MWSLDYFYVVSYSSSIFILDSPASSQIYTLSLHDALPIWLLRAASGLKRVSWSPLRPEVIRLGEAATTTPASDRKSTRLNSSHRCISYAVFCLKKKKKYKNRTYSNTKYVNTTEYRQTTSAM